MSTARVLGIGFLVLGLGGALFSHLWTHDDRTAGQPAYGAERIPGGMTTYCLPESRLRVFERPFPQGGQVPLFSVVNVDTERAGSPWRC